MAGEWLKFDCTLPEKPEVLAITVAMGWDDPDLTVGKLMRVFRWFDQHTIDGNAHGVTTALLDRLIGVAGFVQAMRDVGWIVVSDNGLSLHSFEKHNGATAKSRAQTAKRVANHRANASETTIKEASNAPSVTDALAREEKRREEKKNSPSLRSGENRASRLPTRPGDVGEQTWSDWCALRRGKKATVTETVIAEARKEANKAGITLERFFAIWCIRGSQGLQAEWLRAEERGSQGPPQSFRQRDSDAAAARVAKMTGGLVSAKPTAEVIDVTPHTLDRSDLLEDDGHLRLRLASDVGGR